MMTAMTGTVLTDDSDDREEHIQRWLHRCSRVIMMIVMTVMTDDRNLFKDGDIVVAESGQEGGA